MSASSDGDPGALTIALVQNAPVVADVEGNLAAAIGTIERAAARGATLVVFTECALTGYLLTAEETQAVAQPVPGPATDVLVKVARESGVTVIMGMVVADAGRLFNAAVVCTPDGTVRQYRKAHLPQLGLDRYCTPGDIGFVPFETPVGRLGVQICYDLRFPEVSRALALGGADLLVVLANWPEVAVDYTDFLSRARASENRRPLVAASRVGAERGVRFLGRSQCVLPDGTVTHEAGTAEELLLVQLDASSVRSRSGLASHADGGAGLLASRRPEMYELIARPAATAPTEGMPS